MYHQKVHCDQLPSPNSTESFTFKHHQIPDAFQELKNTHLSQVDLRPKLITLNYQCETSPSYNLLFFWNHFCQLHAIFNSWVVFKLQRQPAAPKKHYTWCQISASFRKFEMWPKPNLQLIIALPSLQALMNSILQNGLKLQLPVLQIKPIWQQGQIYNWKVNYLIQQFFFSRNPPLWSNCSEDKLLCYYGREAKI